MRNMAQTHYLQDNQELRFNTGKVRFHEQRYEITLKKKKKKTEIDIHSNLLSNACNQNWNSLNCYTNID